MKTLNIKCYSTINTKYSTVGRRNARVSDRVLDSGLMSRKKVIKSKNKYELKLKLNEV